MSIFRWFWQQLWITVVFALVLLALYTSIGRQLMPLLETKKADVETWLSAKLNQPVTMSSLQGDWQGLYPVLRIKDLNIAGEHGLTFKQVTAELDLSATIFYRTPVFERIVVSGTFGKLTQLSEHEWQLTPEWIVHFDDEKKDSNSSQVIADWLVLQQYILLRDVEAQLSTLDSQVDSQVDSLNLRQLRWRSLGGQHELNVDLAWGRENSANIRIQAFLDGDLWPWRKQHARVYVNLEEQDWSSWLDHEDSEGFSIKQLQGSAQGWLNIRNGNLESAYLTSDITKVTLALANDEFTLSDGSVVLAGKHSNNDWHLQLRPNFAEQLPLEKIQLSEVSIGTQKAWQLGVPELDIQQARELLERYKILPEKIALFIDGAAPNGMAKDVRLSFMKDQEIEQWKLDVRASLEEVHSTAFKGIPTLSGISGDLHLQPQGGVVKLSDLNVGLHLPNLYTPSWQLEDLQAEFRWHIFSEHTELQLENARAKLKDNTELGQSWPVTAEMNILLPRHSETEPSLGLLLALPETPLSLHKLLVPDLVGEAVLSWLDDAELSGTAHNAVFALQTEIGEGHPLNSSSSLLSVDLADTGLAYLAEWPEVNKLAGTLYLNSPDLEVSIKAGETLGGRLSAGHARLQDGKLSIHTKVTGDSTEALRYFTETPLQEFVNHSLDGWQAQGKMTTLVDINLAFGQETLVPQINLQTEFKDNQLFLADLNLGLSKLTGKIGYSSQSGLHSDLVEGQVLGGPFRANLSSVVDGDQLSMLLQGKGKATWKGFHQWQKIGILEPIQGQLDYDMKLLMAGGQTELQVTSDLLGTEIKLPAPFTKKIDEPRSLKVKVQAGTDNILNANYDQDVQAEFSLASGQPLRGQIVVGGGSAQLPVKAGIDINGTIEAPIVFEQWWQAFVELNTKPALVDDAATATEIIRRIDLTLMNLTALNVDLGNTHIQAEPTTGYWKTAIDSPVIKGLVDMPLISGPVRLNLDYILLPELEPAKEELLLTEQVSDFEQVYLPPLVIDRLADFNPNDFPLTEASIKEFFVGGRNYGRWQFNSKPVENGMEVDVLDSDLYGLSIQGKLRWLLADGQHQTQLQEVQLKSSDVGAIQRGFRLVPVVEGKSLTGNLDLAWQGSPVAFNTASSVGNINLRIRNGFLVTEEAKALKALGALNFKSVSRRLKLDFSDLYQEGVSFDDLRIHSHIEDNILTLTEPMLVDGPGGKFLISGHTNFLDHSLDMKVALTLPVTGNLPIVAILAGLSPPVAASIYVTEKLIGDDLSRFTSASYSLQGTWEEPDMRIRKAFDDKVDGKESRSFKERFLGIFGRGKD